MRWLHDTTISVWLSGFRYPIVTYDCGITQQPRLLWPGRDLTQEFECRPQRCGPVLIA